MNGIGTRVSAILHSQHDVVCMSPVLRSPLPHISCISLSMAGVSSQLEQRMPVWQTDRWNAERCLFIVWPRVRVSIARTAACTFIIPVGPPSMERTPLTYLYNRQQINFRFRRQFAKCIMKIYYATAMGTSDSRQSRCCTANAFAEWIQYELSRRIVRIVIFDEALDRNGGGGGRYEMRWNGAKWPQTG